MVSVTDSLIEKSHDVVMETVMAFYEQHILPRMEQIYVGQPPAERLAILKEIWDGMGDQGLDGAPFTARNFKIIGSDLECVRGTILDVYNRYSDIFPFYEKCKAWVYNLMLIDKHALGQLPEHQNLLSGYDRCVKRCIQCTHDRVNGDGKKTGPQITEEKCVGVCQQQITSVFGANGEFANVRTKMESEDEWKLTTEQIEDGNIRISPD